MIENGKHMLWEDGDVCKTIGRHTVNFPIHANLPD